MQNETRSRKEMLLRTLCLGLLCIGLLVVVPGVASAKKPVKPPPPPPVLADVGTIYYAQGGALHQMAPDGSGDTTLSSSIVYWAEPSTQTHGGRWFLQVQEVAGATYPAPTPAEAQPQLELFAVHESGSPIVQLTNGRIDGTTFIEPNQYFGGGVGETSCVMRWTAGDSIVSYTAVLATYDTAGNRTVQDGGIYALAVEPDALASQATTAMSGYPLLSLDLDPAETRVLAQSFDWKPDGSAIVYPNHHDIEERLGVWIAWASDGFTTPTLLMDEGTQLRWSPDGTRILFANGGIYSIEEDGSGEQLLVEDPADSKNTRKDVIWPCWSPSGTHIAYTYKEFSVRKLSVSYAIQAATADGDDLGTLGAGTIPRWWE